MHNLNIDGVVVVAAGQKPYGFYYVAKEVSRTLGLPLVEVSAHRIEYLRLFLKQPSFVISVGTLSPVKLAMLATTTRRLIAYIAVEGPFPVPYAIRWLANNTNRLIIVAPSNYVKGELESSNLKVKYIIPHGITLDDCPTSPRKADLNAMFKDKVVLLTVASSSQLRKSLGIYYFLRAWSKLPAEIRKDTFILVKVPKQLRSRVEEYANSLGIKREQYMVIDSILPRKELHTIYRMADLYVHPTLSDGFGLPILESLACGTPVIVLDSGPWNEIVDENVGWLVKVAAEKIVYENNLPYRFKIPDVNDFSKKLAEAIETIKEDRTAFINKCLRHAARFDARRVYRKFLEIMS